jgi:hypothetical protein
MVMARLHVICGNCGCNDMFTFAIDPKGHDMTGHIDDSERYEPATYISCGNCATLHDLSDTIKETKQS